ncbi:matrixin family metalloprotease [uncultured Paludibaculum sp.]|uniref:matrixin family metalloprotease n=1 Tax=uncultured Paludibaculum sp. TaxID=1765020 RepID=UPI002AAB7C88|nr:matrixin family metalloprotease [uncultured Paludibaculum sp.]
MPQKTIEPFPAVKAARAISKGQEDPGFQPVQEYLQRFGYLRANSFQTNRLDDATAEALAQFQQMHGLAKTGAFDEQTRAAMATHRCGMPDLTSGVAFSIRCSWPNPNLTFAFEDGTNDIGGAGEFQAVRNALATWAAAAPLTFTEVARHQNPDVAVDWRPANDPDHSMVGGVLAHADFPPGCSIITDGLPKPLHFDDSENQWVVGAVSGGFDVETVALHEFGHILGLQHSNVAGSVMFPTVSSNFTKRALTADDLGGIHQLYPAGIPAPGTYTIRQKSNNRFLDAHEIADKDFRLVTRPAQNNNTQRWELASVGAVYAIRQKNSGRFLDAHDSADHDFRLVTRTAQNNASQRWVVVPAGDGSFTIRELANLRFVDAHEIEGEDFRLVTRPAQNNNTQRWLLGNVGTNLFTIQQKSNNRFVDAHEVAANDFSVVTRPAQNNDTQRWIFGQVGAVYTIRQKNNGRFVDAHEVAANDFSVVTRPAQNNDTQRWVVMLAGDGSFTIQQLSGGRFVDAHDSAANDFSVVTRTAQNNDSQRWLFDKV